MGKWCVVFLPRETKTQPFLGFAFLINVQVGVGDSSAGSESGSTAATASPRSLLPGICQIPRISWSSLSCKPHSSPPVPRADPSCHPRAPWPGRHNCPQAGHQHNSRTVGRVCSRSLQGQCLPIVGFIVL